MKLLNKNLTAISLLALFLVACNAGKDQTNIEIFDDHFDQISVKAQDWDPKLGMDAGMRIPPEGTVPKGFKPYKYRFQPPEVAEKAIKNPYADDFSPAFIERGKNRYDIYCAVCHGTGGAGDGTVAEKFLLKPPSLIVDPILGFNDGRFFHTITAGKGVMGAYDKQIRDLKDRWAVVNYIRTLQKKSKK
ncbi:MAG: cytochrome c [Bdellovibrionales bacterium]|nr:cytochrome c [Bdellovibrionales bacterium]